MEEQSYTHAMTEVSLALAMAFFSIMVLTMVSMSTPLLENELESIQKLVGKPIELLKISSNSTSHVSEIKNNQWIIYYQGSYFAESLNQLDITQFSNTGSVMLAVSPQLSLSEVAQIKSKIYFPNVSITLLDEAWLDRLETK